jgi:hypothetical protein
LAVAAASTFALLQGANEILCTFPRFLPVWLELGLHFRVIFLKMVVMKGVLYVGGVNGISPVVYILRLIWIKFCKGNALHSLLSDCEVRENRRSECCFLLGEQVDFCPYCPPLLSDLVETPCKRYGHKAAEHLRGS